MRRDRRQSPADRVAPKRLPAALRASAADGSASTAAGGAHEEKPATTRTGIIRRHHRAWVPSMAISSAMTADCSEVIHNPIPAPLKERFL